MRHQDAMGLAPVWPEELLNVSVIDKSYHERGFSYPTPAGPFRHFLNIHEWYDYVKSLRLAPGRIPPAYLAAFDVALRALFMAYMYADFCKLGEMKALAVLEDAVKNAYVQANEKRSTQLRGVRHHCEVGRRKR